jgi:hypothetical protein
MSFQSGLMGDAASPDQQAHAVETRVIASRLPSERRDERSGGGGIGVGSGVRVSVSPLSPDPVQSRRRPAGADCRQGRFKAGRFTAPDYDLAAHIFVARIAGNIVTPEVIARIEYGAAVLGSRVILVMGHGGCGAVKAAIQASEVPGQISALYSHLQPAVDQAGPDLEAAIRANARIQAALLRKASTVISGLLNENKLKVFAAYYDLASSGVTILA